MTEVPGWDSQSRDPERRFDIGRRRLTALVASFAIIASMGWVFWDTTFITAARLKIWYAFNGDDSMRPLRMGAESSEDRLDAAGSFRSIGRDDEISESIATLIAALNDENARVRFNAVNSLGTLVFQAQARGRQKPSDPEQVKKWREAAIAALVKGFSDKDPDFRVAICTALQVMRRGVTNNNEAPPPELIAALKDDSVAVRKAATQALAQFPHGFDSAIPFLLSMLDDSSPLFRSTAAQALSAAWPNPAVVPGLIDGLKSRNREVRYRSAQLLGRVGPAANAAVPQLIAILKAPIDSSSGQAIDDFDHKHDPGRAAAFALGRIAPNDATVKLFIEMLSTGKAEEPGVPDRWIEVAEALHEMGPEASKVVPAVIAALNQLLDSKKNLPHLDPMVEAIGRLAPDSSSAAAGADVLTRLLDPRYRSRHSKARSRAVEILGRLGRAATAAIPRLRALAQEPDVIRITAAAALAAIEADSTLGPAR
jgi:HEAT repeat protein